jgi:hypothetical protein
MARLDSIKAAFEADGFKFQSSCSKNGYIGVCAAQKVGQGPRIKSAYYVEGDHRTMGWLLGFMAAKAVAQMTTLYRQNVIDAFIGLPIDQTGIFHEIQLLLLGIVSGIVDTMKKDIPQEFHDEIEGVYEGCQAANFPVAVEDLWELNIGVDAILAHIYTDKKLKQLVSPSYLKVPLFCNAFAAPGTNHRRFFGRDFMFPTAGVFQDVACLVIYRPDTPGSYGLVSQTAPGIVGSLAAMNSEGVAIGINMSPTALSNPDRPGFNGLLLSRYCMELAGSAQDAVQRILAAQRGVPWFYPVADAAGGAFVVEAGMRLEDSDEFPYLDYVPFYYQKHLPTVDDIKRLQQKYGTTKPRNGAIVRKAGYTYPSEYLGWNKGLWDAYDSNLPLRIEEFFGDLGAIVIAFILGKFDTLGPLLLKLVKQVFVGPRYDPSAFGERGYIDKTWEDDNCPGPYYFAPQRESRKDVFVVTNESISPEMRLVGMDPWTATVAGASYDDIQWRYDELCNKLLSALDDHPDGLNDETAWNLINFLSQEKGYYKPDGNTTLIQVNGSVSLFDLTSRKITSLFGYYSDDPVSIRLSAYLEDG